MRLLSRPQRRNAAVAAQAPEPEAIGACSDRSRVCIRGHIDAVSTHTLDGTPTLEATVNDGTEAVTLVWIGRRKIVGIESGRHVTAHGRIGLRNGARIIYNPRYELAADE